MGLSQISHFLACPVQLLNGNVLGNLPFDGSRYDRITLRAEIWGCLYGLSLDMYIHKIYFFNYVFIVFLIVIFPQTLITDSI